MNRSTFAGTLIILVVAVICLVMYLKPKDLDQTQPPEAGTPVPGESATIVETNAPPARTAAESESTTSNAASGQTLVPTTPEGQETLEDTNAVEDTGEPDAPDDDSLLIKAPPYRPMSPTPQSPRPVPAADVKKPPAGRDHSEP